MNVSHNINDLLNDVREALSRIADVRVEGSRAMVSVPVQYPSGSLSVVEVEDHGDTCWISDMGLGREEAENVSAERAYDATAKAAAKEFGVGFDGYSLFALQVPKGALPAGIVAVANASVRAAIEAVKMDTERKAEARNEILYERLTKIFPESRVAKRAELRGGHTTWDAHNVVYLPTRERTAVFEMMSPHPASVSAKFLMFSDLKANGSLILHAVMPDPGKLDSKGRLITEVAEIVAEDAADAAFRRLLSAA